MGRGRALLSQLSLSFDWFCLLPLLLTTHIIYSLIMNGCLKQHPQPSCPLHLPIVQILDVFSSFPPRLSSLTRPLLIVIKPFRSAASPPHLALLPSLCCVFLQRVCEFLAHSTFHVFVCLYQREDWGVHSLFPARRTVPGTPGCSVDIRCVSQTCLPSTGSLGE